MLRRCSGLSRPWPVLLSRGGSDAAAAAVAAATGNLLPRLRWWRYQYCRPWPRTASQRRRRRQDGPAMAAAEAAKAMGEAEGTERAAVPQPAPAAVLPTPSPMAISPVPPSRPAAAAADAGASAVAAAEAELSATAAALAPPAAVPEAGAAMTASAPASAAPATAATTVPILLVGHSLGGAVAVRLAASQRVPAVGGVIAVDVVEGTALASLEHMAEVLDRTPSRFDSVEAAVLWHVRCGAIRNETAARITVPSRLKPVAMLPPPLPSASPPSQPEGASSLSVPTAAVTAAVQAAADADATTVGATMALALPAKATKADSASAGEPAETGAGRVQATTSAAAAACSAVTWRTDLLALQRHWEGWFKGLSSLFLSLELPKMLMVAGMDRLDTELTVGQIQGKFQLKLVYGAGHSRGRHFSPSPPDRRTVFATNSIQEDQPGEVVRAIVCFVRRFGIFRHSPGTAGAAAAAGAAEPGMVPPAAAASVVDEEREFREKLRRAKERVPQPR
ncbi:unnamed protein product [Phaeothamnion confervicola]